MDDSVCRGAAPEAQSAVDAMFSAFESQEHFFGVVDIVGFAEDHACVFGDGIAGQDDSLVDVDFLYDIGCFLEGESGDEFRWSFSRADTAFGGRIGFDDFETIAVLREEFFASGRGASQDDGPGVRNKVLGGEEQVVVGARGFGGHGRLGVVRRWEADSWSELIPGLFQGVEESGDVSGGEVDSAAYGRLWVEIGDEVKAEFVGTVSDHDGVGVGSGEDFVFDFEFVVDVLGVLAFGWLLGVLSVLSVLSVLGLWTRGRGGWGLLVAGRVAGRNGGNRFEWLG